ncbi:PAS domain S-box protein [Rhodocaloribacter litoris]|uniref:sensor histidine kinase n=1 Tax=Rhodocaloribacter litoris TaxID=2558931 RepID=UPI0014232ACB|nr:PAS domain S-box protein [Rhodocaloribacter litoris]QXD16573.1 PAS domain S-box protein [Rhodocaloribacter litoris]
MKALPLREAQLRVLLEHALDVILVLAGDGTIVYASASVARTLGYDPEELLGAVFSDFVHPDDERLLHRDAVYPVGQEAGQVLRFRHRDGMWRVLEVVWRWGEGHGERILSARDVTERRWAEEALRESEQQYRALIEQSADAIYVLQEGSFVLVNRAWEQLFGYTRAEALAPSFDAMGLVAPSGRAWMVRRRRLQALGRRVSPVFEIQGLRCDGCLLDLEVSEADILWKGRPAIQGVARNVTERKRSEAALRRYAERLEVLRGIDRALLSAPSSATIAEAAVRHIRKLIPCAWAGVLLGGGEDAGMETPCVRMVVAAQEGEAAVRLPEAAFSLAELGLTGTPEPESMDLLLDLSRVPLQVAGPAPAWRPLREAGIRSVLRVPLRMQATWLGLIALGARASQAFTPDHLDIAREVAEQLSVAVHSMRLFEAVSAAHVRLERLSHRLVEVQEQERRHIALELHDEIGQVLTALNYTLDFADTPLAPEDEAKLHRARELVHLLTARVRNLSLNLRPPMLDDLGLLPALVWYFERYQQQTGLRVCFDPGNLHGERFRPEVETAAYRIIQEALNNAARHAETDTVEVRVWTGADGLLLEVRDEGKGFDPRQMAQARPSAGLSGMQERAALVGGRLYLEAAPGRGTRIRAELPRWS